MARRTGSGFWSGLLTGLVVAALAALALAWIYPPLQPPALDDGALDAPAAPGAPEGGAVAPEPMRTPASGPLVEGMPRLGTPPGASPAPGPGSPSLVPENDG